MVGEGFVFDGNSGAVQLGNAASLQLQDFIPENSPTSTATSRQDKIAVNPPLTRPPSRAMLG